MKATVLKAGFHTRYTIRISLYVFHEWISETLQFPATRNPESQAAAEKKARLPNHQLCHHQRMFPKAHPAISIAVFQIATVIIGVFMTRMAFALNGYPTEELEWNYKALLVRNWGFLVLMVPALWTWFVIRAENKSSGIWSRSWTIISGLLTLLALAALFLWSFSNTYFYHSMQLRAL